LPFGGLLAKGEAWKVLAVQGELWDRPPPRRFVNLDTVKYVARPKEGGAAVVGRRGKHEVHINLSDGQVAELLAGLGRVG
jgi:hypothetical protein